MRTRNDGATRSYGDLDQGIHLGHLVTAPSHCSCHLFLKATRGVPIALGKHYDGLHLSHEPALVTHVVERVEHLGDPRVSLPQWLEQPLLRRLYKRQLAAMDAARSSSDWIFSRSRSLMRPM